MRTLQSLVILSVCLLTHNVVGVLGKKQQTQKVFQATEEWKEIAEDEAIPKGLHVRINLTTGKKEAKLMDDGHKNEKKLKTGELQQYLKGIKDEAPNLKETDKSKFRDMDTIKKDFNSLKLTPVKSESHTIQELLTLLRGHSISDSEKIHCLKEMEFLLHQYDVARDFVKMNGTLDLLTSLSERTLREDAATALGAALQGNPVVQQAVLDQGGIVALSDSLEKGCGPQCVFALSTLLRQFPKAQLEFANSNGPIILGNILRERNASQKLKLRAITMISDLVVEKNHAMSGKEGKAIMKAYEQVNLAPIMVRNGFCELLFSELSSTKEDVREKSLNAIHAFLGSCNFENLVSHLESLSSHYNELMMTNGENNNPDEYYHGLHSLVVDIVKHITDKDHFHVEL